MSAAEGTNTSSLVMLAVNVMAAFEPWSRSVATIALKRVFSGVFSAALMV